VIKVFVTKDRPWKYLNYIEKTKKALFIYRSCINLKVNSVLPPPATDWLFFSSPSGVRLYLENFEMPVDTKVAVLGEGTAAALEGVQGMAIHFVPESRDVEIGVMEFASLVGPDETVLYPRSESSLLRLHSVLSPPRLVDWPFYENIPHPPSFPIYDDYLVFTSPSNASAYLSKHRVRTNQRLVAIGYSTGEQLATLGVQRYLVSEAPTPEAIWKCIAEDAGLPV
jgi:uroporphyrinogen-III synthase